MDIQNPAEPVKFNSKKILIPVGIVIILGIFIAVGFWYFSNNPQSTNSISRVNRITQVASPSATISAPKDPTADWKTYTNNEVKFTIKYPATWKFNDVSVNAACSSDQVFFAPDGATLGRCSSGFGGIIGIFRTEVGTDITKQAAQYTNTDYKNLVKANTTVAGKNAIKITATSQISNEALNQKDYTINVYLVDLGGNRCLILNYAQSPDWVDSSANFETMVTSLKFF